ncbi:MAG: PLP-dependent aminotransferase family protein [Pseudonocardiaceae bacterium]
MLETADLHGSLEDPVLTSMNFLNEITSRYPEALSFAAGRPTEQFFDVESLHQYLRTFCRYLSNERGYSAEEVTRVLCQYGRTNGIVHELIARHLLVDEDLEVDPGSIVVTVGCQEAIFLVLRALRADDHDVVLSVSPMYVGLTGAARLLDMPVVPVASGESGVDLDDFVARVRGARERDLRPRACYIVPDFANPSGARLDLATRRALLDVAAREGILLLEDNPYGLFRGEVGVLPTLKALDTWHDVIYLGSFAKTVLPGARVGYVVADQPVRDRAGGIGALADQLSKIKSMVTVNTSPLAQAVIGGKLLEHGCSLYRANVRECQIYRRNMRRVVEGLRARFGANGDITWNIPSGGFFAVVTVPFEVDDELLEVSAREYGVLWTPMRHFYDGSGGLNQLRLSISSLNGAQIDAGLDRLAAVLHDRGVSRLATGT